ncbi:glutamate N-acetyltransferase [Sugiyamaella lignohabitans]|uniref:Arginine biosynthesis bifunctional protein ArgJ, mitochondrial n=1 Tax=Sugiyamaella lignohabitans TaxID=796027 RepID=A0A161HGT5_9ASCO|nr:glutamate N-acetyltransferase [Sugiyamaella lignohabitans]ANB11097.1 glutamate N-acetyltransferase [Sugiyamaella lignohabitans]
MLSAVRSGRLIQRLAVGGRGPRQFSTSTVALVADKSKYVPSSGIYPQGYKVGAIHCGVKKNAEALDLSVLVSETPCSGAAVFTTNIFQAAPVQVSKKVLSSTKGTGIRSIIVNSGCANAVTGEGGLKDAEAMVSTTDRVVGVTSGPASLVMSTGVIGQRLPIDKILNGIPSLIESNLGTDHNAWVTCARGICTTDTFPKLTSKEFSIGSNTYRIAGLAKGAGMIHPNMATLLGFFVTDAPVSQDALHDALKYATDRSFNSISVDGDMSTNDTIAALANGAAGGPVITKDSDSYEVLRSVITEFAEELAQLVVRDGEGATKFVTIKVEDALNFADAKQVASSIATSSLVKTALYGKDANWGRILCATGYAGVPVEPFKTSVSFIPTDGTAELKLLVNGEPEQVDEERASEILALEDLEIKVSLGTGGGASAKFWTCDLSHEYVTINGDYRS